MPKYQKMVPLKNEKWVSLKKLGFSNYMASNKGRFMNKKGNIIQQAYTPNGDLGVKLYSDSGKRITNRSQRLIALTFIPNDDPEHKTDVTHKDRNKKNNTVENLEWIERHEKMVLLEDEKWVSLNKLGFSNYMISNKGRFMNKRGNIVKQSFTPDRYLTVKMFDDSGQRVTNRVNRLVAKVFLPNDDPENKTEVNHKNFNKEDNTVENLEWVTGKENVHHAIIKGHMKHIFRRGEDSPRARHTEAEVRTVCKLFEKGASIKKVRKLYPNFTEDWLGKIKRRKIWNHITQEYKF